MNICHIQYSLGHGGIETMIVGIVNEQVKTEQVSLIIINNLVDEKLLAKVNKRVQIIRLNRKPKSKNPFFILELNYFFLKIKPDVIHSHIPDIVNLIAPFFRNKVILTRHNTNSSFAIPYFPKYKKIYSISKSVQQELLKYGFSSEVVYNGVDIGAISKNANNNFDSIFRIIQISRLYTEQKGQHILIEAVERLVHKHNINDIHVDFAGTGSDFDMLAEIVKEKKLENNISFLGDVKHFFLEKHICDYDLLVQPSLFEGFGLTVVEGMAAEIPVLVSDIEGPMEVINYGEFGYYFRKGEAGDLAEKIMLIMSAKNIEEQKLKVENALQYAEANFDVKRTAREYITKYNSL